MDSFITNNDGVSNKNFGLTEILKIGTVAGYSSIISPTTSQSYSDSDVVATLLEFDGTISGSLMGNVNFFNGIGTGNNSSIDTSYFSGSINNISQVFSGSILNSSFNGTISGSLVSHDCLSTFQGTASNLNGNFRGTITGNGLINYPSSVTVNNSMAWRTLIKFDSTDISHSIVNNSISSASFYLKLSVCEELELPLDYTVYAFAVSQSWNMGTGYLSDGGSTDGVSWINRDGVSEWMPISSSIHSNIQLTDSASVDGGGTWYSSSICSQSFGYKTTDINMDITSIVNMWLDRSIPNEGIILIASAEVTGTPFTISYFSENTNTIYSPVLDMGYNSLVYITGSTSTSNTSIVTNEPSISGITTTQSYFTHAPDINGIFSGSAGLNTMVQIDPTILSASGIVFGTGLTGNIINLPFIGGVIGTVSSASYEMTGSCGNTFNAQLITASFIDGIWSGFTFTSYYVDGDIKNAIVSGSFPNSWLSNSNFSVSPLPTNTSSYCIANLNNEYISGDLIGKISFHTTSSASFNGFFNSGVFKGYEVVLPFIGNIYTSSISYTSSINYTTTTMSIIDVNAPFNINVKDLNYNYQRGNLIRIFINSSEKYSSKNFNVGYQFSQYSVLNSLPINSYYGIRDNITNEMIINFDDYTQLSCDYPIGNYFDLDTNRLFPEREYQILIKIVSDNDIYTIDTGKKFKIVR